jgi:hypothetical protein
VPLRRSSLCPLLALLAAGTGAAAESPGVDAAESPSRLASVALSDARASGSVHVSGTLTTDSGKVTLVADVGVGEGRSKTELSYATIDVIQLGDVAYARSSTAAGLVQFIGWKPRLAQRYAGRWVRYARASRAFASLTSESTLPAVLSALALHGALRASAPVNLGGQRASAITGKLPPMAPFNQAVLDVTRSARPLPLREVQTGAGKLSEVTALSDWGEHVALEAPPGAVTLQGVSSSG